MFLGFANFYKQFIKGFSKIAALLIYILKMATASPKGLLKAGNKARKIKISRVKLTEVENSKNLTRIKLSKIVKINFFQKGFFFF